MDGEWFKGSVEYWKQVDSSINGVLGGYGILHDQDIRDSRIFLNKFLNTVPARCTVLGNTPSSGLCFYIIQLDVGAGIGRVSKSLLAEYFEKVSILESDERFVTKAKSTLGPQLGHVYQCRLQEFRSSKDIKFDLVWIQWVLPYASDEDLRLFLGECKKSLQLGGLIIIKENVLSKEKDPEIDELDRSIIRSRNHFIRIFNELGLHLVIEMQQTGFPSSLYPVWMFCLGTIAS